MPRRKTVWFCRTIACQLLPKDKTQTYANQMYAATTATWPNGTIAPWGSLMYRWTPMVNDVWAMVKSMLGFQNNSTWDMTWNFQTYLLLATCSIVHKFWSTWPSPQTEAFPSSSGSISTSSAGALGPQLSAPLATVPVLSRASNDDALQRAQSLSPGPSSPCTLEMQATRTWNTLMPEMSAIHHPSLNKLTSTKSLRTGTCRCTECIDCIHACDSVPFDENNFRIN